MKRAWQKMCVGVLAVAVLVSGGAGANGVQAAATVTGTVDWDTTIGSTTGFNYGMNIYKAHEDGVESDPDYKANVSYMKPGIVRYHRASQMADTATDIAGWVHNPDTADYAWDTVKIDSMLSNTFSNNPVRMMNIVNWPAYMDDGNGKLKSDMYDDYAAFCAELVQIVNIDQGHDVLYWEVTNERDDIYADDMAELAAIYNQAADAMKQVDPNIKVGGPAFARPDLTARVDTFIANAHGNLDFVSLHTYSSGSTSDTNAQIWDRAQNLGGHTDDFESIIDNYTTRDIEIFHDEFNISWNPPDDRMNNIKGAIFDALALMSITKAGATGSMAWNEADGWYGKLEGWSPYNKRPSAEVYYLFNTDMGGGIADTSVSDSGKVDMMGTVGGSWKKLALVNRSEQDETIALSFSGWDTTMENHVQFTVKRVYSWGLTYESVTYGELKSGYTLPADTVTVLVINENDKSYATPTITNGDFENGLTGWASSGEPSADYTESWAGWEGDHLTHWDGDSAYQVATSQTVTGLVDGTYTVSAKFSSGGGQSLAQLQVDNYGGSQLTADAYGTGTYAWDTLTISGVNVTNGQMTLTFESDADAGQWLYIDDVTITPE